MLYRLETHRLTRNLDSNSFARPSRRQQAKIFLKPSYIFYFFQTCFWCGCFCSRHQSFLERKEDSCQKLPRLCQSLLKRTRRWDRCSNQMHLRKERRKVCMIFIMYKWRHLSTDIQIFCRGDRCSIFLYMTNFRYIFWEGRKNLFWYTVQSLSLIKQTWFFTLFSSSIILLYCKKYQGCSIWFKTSHNLPKSEINE